MRSPAISVAEAGHPTKPRGRPGRPLIAAADDGTKGARIKLSIEVFELREAAADRMAGMMNCIDNSRGGRRRDERSAGAAWQESPAAEPVERMDGYQALLDEGLRLNRAFASIKDPFVREAIVNLVVATAKSEGRVELRLPDDSRTKTAEP
jgi:hypothetical protein